MAWSSISAEHEALNLDAFQKRQAETKTKELEGTVETRVFETWCWALAPSQPDPKKPSIEWDTERLQGNEFARCSLQQRGLSIRKSFSQRSVRRASTLRSTIGFGVKRSTLLHGN